MYPWTEIGTANFGALIDDSRIRLGWSWNRMRDELLNLPDPYRYSISGESLGKLRSGRPIPRRNLVVALAKLGRIKREGELLNFLHFDLILSEALDCKTWLIGFPDQSNTQYLELLSEYLKIPLAKFS